MSTHRRRSRNGATLMAPETAYGRPIPISSSPAAEPLQGDLATGSALADGYVPPLSTSPGDRTVPSQRGVRRGQRLARTRGHFRRSIVRPVLHVAQNRPGARGGRRCRGARRGGWKYRAAFWARPADEVGKSMEAALVVIPARCDGTRRERPGGSSPTRPRSFAPPECGAISPRKESSSEPVQVDRDRPRGGSWRRRLQLACSIRTLTRPPPSRTVSKTWLWEGRRHSSLIRPGDLAAWTITKPPSTALQSLVGCEHFRRLRSEGMRTSPSSQRWFWLGARRGPGPGQVRANARRRSRRGGVDHEGRPWSQGECRERGDAVKLCGAWPSPSRRSAARAISVAASDPVLTASG